MKITEFQIHEAYQRAVLGESVRSLARGLGVDESTLRQHFRKGPTPRQIRELAGQYFHAQQARGRLDEKERQICDALVAKGLAAHAGIETTLSVFSTTSV
jgi:hypothetical protein